MAFRSDRLDDVSRCGRASKLSKSRLRLINGGEGRIDLAKWLFDMPFAFPSAWKGHRIARLESELAAIVANASEFAADDGDHFAVVGELGPEASGLTSPDASFD